MNEGPGHVPIHMIEENMVKQLEWCGEAPFYTSSTRSPPTSCCAWLRPHPPAASARKAMIGWYGCAMLWLRHAQGTPRPAEQEKDVKDGVITYKIAAHRRRPGQGAIPARNTATTPSPRRALNFAGKINLTSVARPRDRARVPRRNRCRRTAPRPRTSAPCAACTSAR